MRKLLMTLALTLPLFASGEPPQPARFEKSFKILRDILKVQDRNRLIDQLVAKGRGPLFSIEGLARIYEDRYPDTMSSLLKQSKALEDRLGKHIDMVEHVAYAKEIGVDAATIRHLQKLVREDRKETEHYHDLEEEKMTLVDFLLYNDWIESYDPRLAKWENKVAKTDWDGPKKDRDYILQKLFDVTQELRRDEWNMGDIQDGIHDFRRRVRWLSIYVQSLADLLVLDYPELPLFDEILTSDIATSKYGALPPGDKLAFPILFPHALYLELTKAIQELGYAKDSAEAMYEWLPEALLASGQATTLAAARRKAAELVKKHKNYRDPRKTADKIYAYLRKNDHRYGDKTMRGVLVALKERFKAQMGWRPKDCRRELEEQAEITPAGQQQ